MKVMQSNKTQNTMVFNLLLPKAYLTF